MHFLGSTLAFRDKKSGCFTLVIRLLKEPLRTPADCIVWQVFLTNACTIVTSPTDSSLFVIKFNCILPTEKPLSPPAPLHALLLKKTLGYHMNYCSAYFCSLHAFQKHHWGWSIKLYVLQEVRVNPIEVDANAFALQILVSVPLLSLTWILLFEFR